MNEKEAIRKAMRQNPMATRRLQEMARRGQLMSSEDVPGDVPLVVVGGAWPSTINGSKQVKCESCKCLLGISPSTQEMMAKRIAEVTIRCFPCVTQQAALEGMPTEVTH